MPKYATWKDVEAEARRTLNLRSWLEQRGVKLTGANRKNVDVCPLCKSKGKAAVLDQPGGAQLYKCFGNGCTANKALNEIGFMQAHTGQAFADASRAWYQEAGIDVKQAGRDIWQAQNPIRHTSSKGLISNQPADDGDAQPEESGPGESVSSAQSETCPPSTNDSGDDEFRPLDAAGEVPAELLAPQPLIPPDAEVSSTEAAGVFLPEATCSFPSPGTASPPCESAPSLCSGDLSAASGSGEGNGGASQQEPAVSAAGSEAAQAEADAEAEALNDSASDARREFYALARELDDAPLRELWTKRGLVPSFVEWAGLKWCHPDNTRVIHELARRYTKGALLRAGLMQVPKGGNAESAKANRQMCGWGLTGRKVEAADPDDGETDEAAPGPRRFGKVKPKAEAEWGEVNPVLIPYFNETGDVVHVRPHKGMIAGMANHFFVARPCRKWADAHAVEMAEASKPVRYAVVCEAELKALAVAQALWPKVAAASMQGIANAKDWFLMDPLQEWLEGLNHAEDFRVVVVYDNEEKGDPRLAGYSEKKDARHDSLVWARYLAETLERKAWKAVVGMLPNAWRDEKGKADWDGALAKLIRET